MVTFKDWGPRGHCSCHELTSQSVAFLISFALRKGLNITVPSLANENAESNVERANELETGCKSITELEPELATELETELATVKQNTLKN